MLPIWTEIALIAELLVIFELANTWPTSRKQCWTPEDLYVFALRMRQVCDRWADMISYACASRLRLLCSADRPCCVSLDPYRGITDSEAIFPAPLIAGEIGDLRADTHVKALMRPIGCQWVAIQLQPEENQPISYCKPESFREAVLSGGPLS